MKKYIIILKENGCKRVEYMLQSYNKLMIRDDMKPINNLLKPNDRWSIRIKSTVKD